MCSERLVVPEQYPGSSGEPVRLAAALWVQSKARQGERQSNWHQPEELAKREAGSASRPVVQKWHA